MCSLLAMQLGCNFTLVLGKNFMSVWGGSTRKEERERGGRKGWGWGCVRGERRGGRGLEIHRGKNVILNTKIRYVGIDGTYVGYM